MDDPPVPEEPDYGWVKALRTVLGALAVVFAFGALIGSLITGFNRGFPTGLLVFAACAFTAFVFVAWAQTLSLLLDVERRVRGPK